MRKRTIRTGMRLILAALLIIILVSFYHDSVSDIFSFSYASETRFYEIGIFLAAAMGGYGVVSSAIGLVLPAQYKDSGIRITPLLLMIFCGISLFFYLLVISFDTATEPVRERLRPGVTITI